MSTDDHGHPESEDDLVEIRKQNNERRRQKPDLPTSVGESDRGVLPGEPKADPDESAKASGS